MRVVMVTGTGRAFSVGDDITGRSPAEPTRPLVTPVGSDHRIPTGTPDRFRAISQALNIAIQNLDRITVAAINGEAVQTGHSLALGCDSRVPSEKARLRSGTLRFGLLPDEGGQYLLVQHPGAGRTLDSLLRNRVVEAAEALALGLVHKVVSYEPLLEESLETLPVTWLSVHRLP